MPVRFRILRAEAGPQSGRGPTAQEPGLLTGPSEERGFEIATDLDEITVGRQPGTAIELPFPAVSTLHARLYRGDLPADWWVEDLGSMNGTWLDGKRLGARSPVPLRAGQRLRIATVDLVFEGWSKNPRGAESTASIARRLISDLFGVVGGEVPTLTVEAGGAPAAASGPSSVRLTARDRPYLAGRAEGCDLVLAGEHVSREHARFVRRWDGVVVEDLGSRNGVRVNGRTISGEHKLGDGDRIEVGVAVLRLADPEDRYLRHLHSLSGAERASTGASKGPSTRPSNPIAPARAAVPTPVVVTATPPDSSPPLARSPTPGPIEAAGPPPTRSAQRRSGRALLVLAASVVAIAVAGLLLLLLSTR